MALDTRIPGTQLKETIVTPFQVTRFKLVVYVKYSCGTGFPSCSAQGGLHKIVVKALLVSRQFCLF